MQKSHCLFVEIQNYRMFHYFGLYEQNNQEFQLLYYS